MYIDPRVVVFVAVALTVLLWAAAIVLGRVDWRVTARGFRNGALIAAGLFAITATIVAFVFNGRAVFVVTLDLSGAIGLGLLVGAVVAVGYLWMGGLLIAIGLIFKSKPQWTTLGAWAAVPVIVMAAGFGYASFRSVASEGAAASDANGSLHLATSGTPLITADGAATCATDAAGTVTIGAGTSSDPHIISNDARLISVQITMSPDAPNATLVLTIAAIDTTDLSSVTTAGSGPSAGQLSLSAPAWTGTLSWACNL